MDNLVQSFNSDSEIQIINIFVYRFLAKFAY